MLLFGWVFCGFCQLVGHFLVCFSLIALCMPVLPGNLLLSSPASHSSVSSSLLALAVGTALRGPGLLLALIHRGSLFPWQLCVHWSVASEQGTSYKTASVLSVLTPWLLPHFLLLFLNFPRFLTKCFGCLHCIKLASPASCCSCWSQRVRLMLCVCA